MFCECHLVSKCQKHFFSSHADLLCISLLCGLTKIFGFLSSVFSHVLRGLQEYIYHCDSPPCCKNDVHAVLNHTIPDWWIGRGGPLAWPPSCKTSFCFSDSKVGSVLKCVRYSD